MRVYMTVCCFLAYSVLTICYARFWMYNGPKVYFIMLHLYMYMYIFCICLSDWLVLCIRHQFVQNSLLPMRLSCISFHLIMGLCYVDSIASVCTLIHRHRSHNTHVPFVSFVSICKKMIWQLLLYCYDTNGKCTYRTSSSLSFVYINKGSVLKMCKVHNANDGKMRWWKKERNCGVFFVLLLIVFFFCMSSKSKKLN